MIRAAGLPEDKLLVVGTGAEGLAFLKKIEKGGPYQLEAAMFPEKVGFTAMDTAVAMFKGEELPEHVVSPTTPLTAETWKQYCDYYGQSRRIKWDAVNAVEAPDRCMKYASDFWCAPWRPAAVSPRRAQGDDHPVAGLDLARGPTPRARPAAVAGDGRAPRARGAGAAAGRTRRRSVAGILAARLCDGLHEIRDVTLHDLGRRLAAIVSFSVEGFEADMIKARCTAAGINVRVSRPSSSLLDATARNLPAVIHASPHYYNSEEEITRTLKLIRAIVQ